MLIVVDSHIPGAADAFSVFGQVVAIPGHEIGPQEVQEATALIVRTVTRIHAGLLAETAVRFVGSATAGMDHMDTAWMDAHGISWAHAHGANAWSVVEYVLAAIAEGLEREGVAASGDVTPGSHRAPVPDLVSNPLLGRTAGVIGHGEVGSRLAGRLRALGCRVQVCDPFRTEGELDIDELLQQSDIVSLHVPLTDTGPHATRNLLHADRIARMKPGAMLIQTSRGGVLDDAAAVRARSDGLLSWLVLDVWQDEPLPARERVAGVDVATPHIAGYSRDAKSAGVHRVALAFREWLGAWGVGAQEAGREARPEAGREAGREARPENSGELQNGSKSAVGLAEGPETPLIHPHPEARTEMAAWIRPMYDIRADDARFRATLGLPSAEAKPLIQALPSAEARRAAFHVLRATYPPRWGFHHYQAAHPGGASPDWAAPRGRTPSVPEALGLGSGGEPE